LLQFHHKVEIKYLVFTHTTSNVKNRHQEDLEYICLITEIINNFNRIFKSIEPNRRTKKTEIFIVFEKKYDNGVIKLVKLRNMKDKALSLKTIFIKD